jgi:hypothetical protein
MTLLEVEELTRYWIDHPPLHLMVGAYLGIGKARHRRAGATRGSAEAGSMGGAEIARLLAELGPSFAGCDVHEGLRPVVLDVGELRRGTRAAD